MVAPRPETVTLLFTDMEGSTKLLQLLGEGYAPVRDQHLDLLRAAVAAHGGRVFGTEGDAVFASFSGAGSALAAAVQGQRSLAAHPWPDGVAVLVRMGIHTGEATPAPDGYIGLDVHRAARIAAAGHGGQVLVSGNTRALGSPPQGVGIIDLGEHRLKDLAGPERIYQLSIPGLPDAFPPLRTLDALPNNLPTQLTSFVGRVSELDQARRLLSKTRLLTLVGPGGTGKTRLALQLAASVSGQYPAGTYFVRLAPVTDPDLLPTTVLEALRVQPAGRPPAEALLDYVADRRLLLLLDNFEQIVPAGQYVRRLLERATRLQVLVTSRAPLHVPGEQEYPVPPLPSPDPGRLTALEELSNLEAVVLFVERAQELDPSFILTEGNAAAVAGITSRLDGLPLAIELAAARTKLLTPQAILTRLGQFLDMASGIRDADPRQQTLRAAIGWSYDLLDEGRQRLFARLSVFAGRFGIEQAEQVCGPAGDVGGEVLAGLGMLLDQSLLRRAAEAAEPRFSLLETIREFAVERLGQSGEAHEIRRRHAMSFLALAEEAAPRLTGYERGAWADRLGQDHANLRAALNWAIKGGEAGIALRLAAALWRFWQMRGHLHEGRERLDEVLAMPGAQAHPAERARAWEAAGGVAHWQGDAEASRRFYEEALAFHRAQGDRAAVAENLYNVSFSHFFEPGQATEALRLLEESLAVFRDLGEDGWIAKALWAIAAAQIYAGNLQVARAYAEDAVGRFRALGDLFGLGWALRAHGTVVFKTGEVETARADWSEALEMFAAAQDMSAATILLDDFSMLAVAEGDAPRAIRLEAAAAALRQSTGTELARRINDWEGRDARHGHSLTKEEVGALWEEGLGLGLDRAVRLALESTGRPVG